MAPKNKLACAMQNAQGAVKGLSLEQVRPESWGMLKEAEFAFTLDLQVEIEHLSLAKLQALNKAFEPLHDPDSEGVELVDWLALPVDVEGRAAKKGSVLPRSKALLATLGQVCGNCQELAGAAASAYLSLLSVHGADRQWSTIFQPPIFRKILQALRVLRRGDLKHKEKKDDTAGADGDEAVDEGADLGGEDAAEGAVFSKAEAMELLQRLVDFLRQTGLGSSAEAAALATEELAALVARPSDPPVAKLAVAGLAALVARAGGDADVRRAAAATIRATMPALLMTQERSALPTVPRPLQQARAVTLAFISGLLHEYPLLLKPQKWKRPAVPGEEEADGAKEGSRKRRRLRQRKTDGEDDESEGPVEGDEDEAGAGAEQAGATPGATGQGAAEGEAAGQDGADGDKKVRRRRPKGKPMDDPVVALLELVCVLTPDRSEWRNYAVDSILVLLTEASAVEFQACLGSSGAAAPATKEDEVKEEDDGAGAVVAVGPAEAIAPDSATKRRPGAADRFMAFLQRILESERVAVRMLATDVAVSSLERCGQLLKGRQEEEHAELVQKLLMWLVRRCSDALPTVRGRALGGVATALQSLARSERGRRLLKELAKDHTGLAQLFRNAAADEKPMVRKAALSFFDVLLPLLQSPVGLEGESLVNFFQVDLIGSLSADESILVRKGSVSSLALLLRSCPSQRACDIWVQNVLPLLLDVEQTVSERALDELEAAVLNPLNDQEESSDVGGPLKALPGVLLRLDSEATEYLQRGLRRLAKRNEDKLPPCFVNSLIRVVKQCLRPLPLPEWPHAIWSMLEEVAHIGDGGLLSFDLVFDAWMTFSTPAEAAHRQSRKGHARGGLGGLAPGGSRQERNRAEVIGAKILRVLEQLVPKGSQERLIELMESLCSALASFAAPVSLIHGITSVIQRIDETWKAKKVYAEREKERTAWKQSFVKSIQAALAEHVRADEGSPPADAKRLGSCLFTLGELALMDMSIISESIVMQVQTIATNTIFRNGQRVETDPSVRGHAFATLGKFCLKKDSLAKKSLELFVLHLTGNESFVVRNNVLISLGDLCVHYTSLVDRFVPCITDLMRDPNELLRKQTAMIMASLLSEDFIKFRGSILLRFLYILSDPSPVVRNFVECVFARILHQRNATMFAQNFLDVVCSLSGWTGLSSFQGAVGNEDFSLAKSPGRRAQTYKFMLALMSNDQKFNVCAQIVTTLLASFVDSEERIALPTSVEEPAGQALGDGLALLSCKEMRICFSTQKGGGEEEEAADATEKANAEAARGVLSSILKRNMCENIVPVLVQMKNLMEAKHSPFLRQLRHCLREILRDFKDDLEAMLAGDQQLAREIAFDLQDQDGDHGESIAKTVGSLSMAQMRGASRRMSLGTMMRTPARVATPAEKASFPEGSPCAPGSAPSGLPKARKSVGGAPATTPARSPAPTSGAPWSKKSAGPACSPALSPKSAKPEPNAADGELSLPVSEGYTKEEEEPTATRAVGTKRKAGESNKVGTKQRAMEVAPVAGA